MAGTKEGGRKASITNRMKYGEDFYIRNGRKGGQNGHTGGFASNPEFAREMGRIGGKLSKRGKAKKWEASMKTNKKTDEFADLVNRVSELSAKDYRDLWRITRQYRKANNTLERSFAREQREEAKEPTQLNYEFA